MAGAPPQRKALARAVTWAVCAQDFPDHYLFRTTQSGPTGVVIEAAWPPDKAGAAPSTSGAYRLTLSGGVWKIDGNSCAEGDHYNWPTH